MTLVRVEICLSYNLYISIYSAVTERLAGWQLSCCVLSLIYVAFRWTGGRTQGCQLKILSGELASASRFES